MTCPDDGVPALLVGRWPPLVFDVPSSVPHPSLSASCVGTPPAVVCVCVCVWLWLYHVLRCASMCGCGCVHVFFIRFCVCVCVWV